MRVLNVGSGAEHIGMPAFYDSWEKLTLDIDPKSGANVIADARELEGSLYEKTFDALYCSHNLEHYYRHDLPRVLAGFRYVIKDSGFVHIHVPNLRYVCEAIAKGADIEDVMYISPAGPIKAVDMLYGYDRFVRDLGVAMEHKNGFTPKSLGMALYSNGFPHVFIGEHGFELMGFGFKEVPCQDMMAALHLKHQVSSVTGDKAGLSPTVQPEPVAAGAQ